MARPERRLAMVALLGASFGLGAVPAYLAPGSGAMDAIEEDSESLGASLTALGETLRSRKAGDAAPFLAETVTVRLPRNAGTRRNEGLDVERFTFDFSKAAPAMPSEFFVRELQHVLDGWSSIESATFELPETHALADGGLAGTFRASIVGRDAQGRRAWIQGTGTVAARRVEGDRWRLDRLVFDDASRLVAPRDFFVDVTAAAGLARPDPSFAERGLQGLVAHGAAAGDIDGDGLVDVVATGLTSNVLFRNLGNGRFEDVAPAAHLAASASPGSAPLLLDFDDDGDEDLFVSAVGRQSLFENRLVPDGKLLFRDVSSKAHVDVESAGFSAIAGDVDGDGRVDVYVACYNRYGGVAPDSWDHAGNGLPNLLFLNQGDGTFREAAKELGVADSRWSYAAELADLDDDGDLDLYVANDFGGPDRLYLNEVRATGKFRDVTAERGLSVPSYGMGVAVVDVDLDGDLDLHVTRMSAAEAERVLARVDPARVPDVAALRSLASGNALYENLGGARFRDVTRDAGPFLAGWSWGAGFFDADNDGRPDLYAPNGFLSGVGARDTRSLFWRQVIASKLDAMASAPAYFGTAVAAFGKGGSFSGHERDGFWLDRGGRFTDLSGVSGLDSPTDGRAAVFADFDDDGDADVFLRAMHSQAFVLFRNDLGNRLGSFRVALEGRASGRDAYGAVVRAKTAAGMLTQVKAGGSGFLAQSDRRLLFGLGKETAVEWLEVAWPSGLRQRVSGPKAGDSIVIVEGVELPRRVQERSFDVGNPALVRGVAK